MSNRRDAWLSLTLLSVLSFVGGCDGGDSGSGAVCDPVCGVGAACVRVLDVNACVCLPGYTGDGTVCTPVPDDVPTQLDSGMDLGMDGGLSTCVPACGANASCDLAPSPACVCDAGFAFVGSACVDIEECALGTDDCDTNATCTNTPGAFSCACNAGYEGSGTACFDANECALGTDDCDTNATCTNTPGAFSCACNAGYAGSGTVCTEVDECVLGTDDCDANATCTNTPGAFACTCNAGYDGSGTACSDVDECALGTDDCDTNATCQNTAGSFGCRCNVGFHGSGTSCMPGLCDPSTDTDTGTASFTITNLGIARTSGFDLDGLNNSAATGGATIAGCGKSDATGGVDNAFPSVAASLEGFVDLDAALGAMIAREVPDGGVEGFLTVDVALTKLAPGNAATDSCVGVTVTVSGAGAPIEINTAGTLVDNVLDFALTAPVHFELPVVLPEVLCVNLLCNPGSLAVDIRGGRARFNLNATHTEIGAGSLIGGFMFFGDCTDGTIDFNTGACVGGSYADANASGLQQAIGSFASMTNLDPSVSGSAIEAFRGARDLHMEPDGTLSICSGSSNTSTNRNSVSVALNVDSL